MTKRGCTAPSGSIHRAHALCVRLVMILSLLALSSCATTQESQNLQADVNDLRAGSAEMKKEIYELGTRVDSLSKGGTTMDALLESQSALNTEVKDLEKDLQFVMGRIEESRHLIDKVLDKDDKSLDTITERIQKNELALKALSDRLAAVENNLAEIRSGSAAHAPMVNGTAPAASAPEKEYDEAYEVFKSGKLADARKLLTSFIKKYPEHSLAGNAQFWVAETYYSEKDFITAILEYENVLEKYPQSRKLPAAILKQAFAFEEIGDIKASKALLRRVMDEYPNSEEASLARTRMNKLETPGAGGTNKPAAAAPSVAPPAELSNSGGAGDTPSGSEHTSEAPR